MGNSNVYGKIRLALFVVVLSGLFVAALASLVKAEDFYVGHWRVICTDEPEACMTTQTIDLSEYNPTMAKGYKFQYSYQWDDDEGEWWQQVTIRLLSPCCVVDGYPLKYTFPNGEVYGVDDVTPHRTLGKWVDFSVGTNGRSGARLLYLIKTSNWVSVSAGGVSIGRLPLKGSKAAIETVENLTFLRNSG